MQAVQVHPEIVNQTVHHDERRRFRDKTNHDVRRLPVPVHHDNPTPPLTTSNINWKTFKVNLVIYLK